VLKWVGLAVAAAFALAYVVERWDEIVAALSRLSVTALVGAFAAVVAGLLSSAQSWRAVMSGLGSPLPVTRANRIYFLGQLGKYVPGSIWPVIAQAELSTEYGVPRRRAAVATLTQMMVSVVVGGVVGILGLLGGSPDAARTYWWLGIVVVAGVVVLTPAVLNRVVALVGRLVKRPTEPMSARGLLHSALWSVVMWCAFGVQLWLLARTVTTDSPALLLASVGGFALAWVVGFVIVLLPAGAGAREAALVLVLSPYMAAPDALALALASRVLMLAGDVALAGAAALLARWGEARRRPAAAR